MRRGPSRSTRNWRGLTRFGAQGNLQAEVARLQGMGVRALFDFGSTQDAKNSSQVIGGADQGGLGLPDRDYYTKTDDKSKRTAPAI